MDNGFYIYLDYKVFPKQRYNFTSPHKKLYEIINKSRNTYVENLSFFSSLKDFFFKITPLPVDQLKPYWNNDSFPSLDCISLYGFLVKYKPKLYVEIGSGNSTKFARYAIFDHNLNTKIISIDPTLSDSLKGSVDAISNEIIRKPLEDIDPKLFCELEAGDILFIDGSHRVFMNSDCMVVFLDILPYLKKGVIVHFHDIFLPYDYIPEMMDKWYSEQYALACYILANGDIFDIILPNYFIYKEPELFNMLSGIWNDSSFETVTNRAGGSFWIIKK